MKRTLTFLIYRLLRVGQGILHQINSILNCNLVPFRVCIMVKFCHEKMLTLYFPKKNPNHLNKIIFNPPPPPPSENLDHPDKKLNSMGIILIP